MNLFGRPEVNAVHLVDDVPQQIARLHAVGDAGKHVGDHAPRVVVVIERERAEVGEQSGPAATVGPQCFIMPDKRQQLWPGNAVILRGPIAPAVRRFNCGTILLPAKLGFLFPLLFDVVEELQEHDPGKQR